MLKTIYFATGIGVLHSANLSASLDRHEGTTQKQSYSRGESVETRAMVMEKMMGKIWMVPISFTLTSFLREIPTTSQGFNYR